MNYIVFLFGLLIIPIGCSQPEKTTSQANGKESPLEGSWELVENRVDGHVVKPVRPQQFKMFHDGFFSFMHLNPDGSFHGSGAGTYSLDGNQYKETFRYYNDTTWIGYADQQTWELRGDTLIFSGFKNVFDRTGKKLPPDAWGGDKFVEKRVRARP